MVGLLLDEGAQAGYIGGHYITKGKYKKVYVHANVFKCVYILLC